MPGCGDTDAKLPEAFYSTSDPASLRQFLSETDVLICSLPSTKHTTHLLDAEKLGECYNTFSPPCEAYVGGR